MYNPATLFKAPEVNPINQKARSIPGLNPYNMYGRVWFFSWFGFFLAFWSWYAIPPLLSVTIQKDLKLTAIDVANSNIVALCATLIVRLIAGPCCDAFGPRMTFVGCLLIGSIPTFLAGTAYTKSQFMALRFFVGILGGSFVPCQVWSTGFFDKNIVGTSNAFTAGFGNAGGGVTYFAMPAIFDSLVHNQHLKPHVAWRVAFVVPGILIVFVAICMILFCDDTPTGKWKDRHMAAERNLAAHGVQQTIVDAPTGLLNEKNHSEDGSGTSTPPVAEKAVEAGERRPSKFADHEAQMGEQQMLETAQGEVVVKPSFKEMLKIFISPQTLVCAAAYFSTFGTELAVNSILGRYYLAKFPKLGQTGTGNWAAMFGLLNIVFRPMGGLFADFIYGKTKTVWSKRIWLSFLATFTGVFLIIIGKINPKERSTVFGLFAGLAFFIEAANGANFAVVPHIHPHANGVVSGFVGACGNIGGIVFAIIFRYHGTHFGNAMWIMGVICICLNLSLAWIRPIPKGQIGGR